MKKEQSNRIKIYESKSSLVSMIILLSVLFIIPLTFLIIALIDYNLIKEKMVTYYLLLSVSLVLLILILCVFIPRIKVKIIFNFDTKCIIYKNKKYEFKDVFYHKAKINQKDIYTFYLKTGEELFSFEDYRKVNYVLDLFEKSL